MSLWTSGLISLLLLQAANVQAQQANEEEQPVLELEASASSAELPNQLLIKQRNWELSQVRTVRGSFPMTVVTARRATKTRSECNKRRAQLEVLNN